MTFVQFGEVAKVVLELWSSTAFQKSWNAENQAVAYQRFATFEVDEAKQAFRSHRFDKPNSREPEFAEVAARLWAARKAKGGPSQPSTFLPYWNVVKLWGDNRSDNDLEHSRSVLFQKHGPSMAHPDKLTAFIESCPLRSPCALMLCWAVDHNHPLTFKRGSDEWHWVMDEYDRNRRTIDRHNYRDGLRGRGGARVEAVSSETGPRGSGEPPQLPVTDEWTEGGESSTEIVPF